jgi:hypothetical protein
MPCDAATVFALLHDYDRRLEWDTLLRDAHLTGGHTRACKGATSLCTGKPCGGIFALETLYIAFQPGRMAAVKMINRPPLFEAFSASIEHTDHEHGSSLKYTFQFRARPKYLRGLLEPLMLRALRKETQQRLTALSEYLKKHMQSSD